MQTFDQLGLSEGILKSISELGFVNPTPIQEKCIPYILEKKSDLIGVAQTGTGKTAAFGLPVLNQLDFSLRKPQSIILCPTRELCIQIAKDLKSYTTQLNDCRILAVYGGASIVPQRQDLRRGQHIIVGTPGRTLDLIKRRDLDLSNIKWLILDEADEMLNMGFQEELNDIFEHVPEDRQTLLFSATMPRGVLSIANKYMKSPDEISVGQKNSGATNVEHEYYLANARDHYAALKRIADLHPEIYAMVFCRTRAATRELADKLMKDGYNADTLHGDLSQAQRDYVMDRFRQRNLQILVCTDVAARGLDVDDLTHVINYGLPNDSESYIHRSGRTGRAGKKGISISIIHTREKRKLKDIERTLNKKFDQKQIPNGNDVCERQLINQIDKLNAIKVDEKGMATFLPVILEKLADIDREELIKRFVSVEFNRFLSYYENAPDLNVLSKDNRNDRRERGERSDRGDRRDRGERSDRRDRGERSDRGERNDRRDRSGSERRSDREQQKFTRFYINLGSVQQLNPVRLLTFINQNTRGMSVDIGQIEILSKFSFFEADSKYEKELLTALKHSDYEGEKVAVQVSTPDPKDSPDFRQRQDKKSARVERANTRSSSSRSDSDSGFSRRRTDNDSSKSFIKKKRDGEKSSSRGMSRKRK